MNPLASTQPVRRVLTLVSAIGLVVLLVACGSNNNSAPSNPVGFGNSSLSGTYVFSSSGEDGLGGFAAIALTIFIFAVICVLTYFAFIYAPALIARTGESGLSVITRLMGLILAVVGTQMAIIGISGAFNLTSNL